MDSNWSKAADVAAHSTKGYGMSDGRPNIVFILCDSSRKRHRP
jgi:hypothetical protein